MPYLRGMDFSKEYVLANPMSHVRMYFGNLCNLSCKYCFSEPYCTSRGHTSKSVLRDDLHSEYLLDTIDKIVLLTMLKTTVNTKTVFINGKGEPTLEPGFNDFIMSLRAMNLTPVVATNGTSLFEADGPNWEFMYDNGVSLLLKMNIRGNPEKDAAILGLRPDSKQYRDIAAITTTNTGMEWVRRFAAKRRIGFNCVLMDDTAGDDGAPAVLRFCRENGAVPWFDWLMHTGRGRYCRPLNDVQADALVKKLMNIDSEYGYKYTFTKNMNLGCTPEMNDYFVQITEHGRLMRIAGPGARPQEAPNRYTDNCVLCSDFPICTKMNLIFLGAKNIR